MKQLPVVNNRFGSGLGLLEFLFIICATIFYINFKIQAQFLLVAPFIALFYIGYCIYAEPKYRLLIIKLLVFITLLVLLFVTLTESTSIGDVDNRFGKIIYAKFSQWVLVFFPLFLFHRTFTKASKKQILLIVAVGLLNAILLVRTALNIIDTNPTLLHSMDADTLEDAGVSLQGFSFVYAYTFLALTCYICFRYTKNKWAKYFCLGLMLYSVYFMFASQFALSLVTTFISFVYLQYNLSTHNRQKKLLTIIGIIIFICLLPVFLKFLMSISDMEILNVRLEEMYNALSGKGSNIAESDLYFRLDLYWKSIVAFFHSPILGNRTLGFDPHSTFLSVLADLGIMGGIVIYSLFSNSFKFMKSSLNTMYRFYTPLLCQILLMGFTNPIHSSPSIYIMLWFICPLLITLLVHYEQRSYIN